MKIYGSSLLAECESLHLSHRKSEHIHPITYDNTTHLLDQYNMVISVMTVLTKLSQEAASVSATGCNDYHSEDWPKNSIRQFFVSVWHIFFIATVIDEILKTYSWQ